MSKRKTKSQGSKTEHDDEVLGKAYDHQIMMRLLRYVTPHQGHILLALLFNGINALTNLAGPYLIKVALDSAIGGHNLTLLTQIVALYLLANLCSWGVTYGQIYVMSWVGQSVIYTIRTQLFNHLQELSLSFYDQHKVGRIMSRLLSDVGVLREFISWAIIAVFSDFFTLSGIILIMLSMNARLSLLTFTLLPVMAAVTNFWRVHARDTYRDVRRRIGRVNASLQENISGVRVVQSFCREDENLQHFDSINRDHLEANLSAARLSALFFPTVDLIDALAVAMVIWYGGSQVLGQQLTAGLLVAFVLYIERFFDPIRDLARRYNTLQATMAAGERIFELLDTEPDIVEPEGAFDLPPLEGRVCLVNVSFGYDGETKVLNNVNLVVEPGQTVAFVGETGAGKSSLVRLLGRFYDVDQGAITVDGYDVRTVSRQSLRSQMGIVLQDTFLFRGSVRDNIRYGRLTASDEEVVEAAQAVGAHDFIVKLPQGYDTEIEEGGAILSVGQRQLISFARALLANPRILILDEATSSVDTQTEVLIQQALTRLLKGRTAFIIAHRLSTIKRADRIIVLHAGRIVEMGTHQELLARSGYYYHLYTMGFRQPDYQYA